MPQMKNKGLYLFLTLVIFISGCGSGSDSGKVFVPGPGHSEEWVNPLYIGRNGFHGSTIKTAQSGSPGATLFVLHCGACHGNDSAGKIGPDIQGVQLPLITGAISVIPLMKGHSILSEGELMEIADYLAAVAGNITPVKIVIDTISCMECHGSDLKGGISRISCFACHDDPYGSVGHPEGWASSKDDPVNFHGKYGENFKNACSNCHGFDLQGGIGPRCSSCHNGNIAPVLGPFLLTQGR